FVADVNRDPAGEQHGGFWTSAVAARMPNGRPIYFRPLNPGEIAHRLGIAHEPFHNAIHAALRALLAAHPRVLLLDLHSFGAGLGGDVILGDRNGRTAAAAAVGLVAGAFEAAGLDVRRNERFSGGWTVRRFAGDERVDAIQVELNQRRYLDLDQRRYPHPPPPGDFGGAQRLLRRVLAEVAGRAAG
ncbi:MAG TPA: N-formylglutamate amidohydrolase, partial [Streptosporangiaceae bacterium]